MRSALLVLSFVACAPAFTPARVYVVAPASVPVMTMASGQSCESASVVPAIACGDHAVSRFDGCRWACGPWFQPAGESMPALAITVNGYEVGEALTRGAR